MSFGRDPADLREPVVYNRFDLHVEYYGEVPTSIAHHAAAAAAAAAAANRGTMMCGSSTLTITVTNITTIFIIT